MPRIHLTIRRQLPPGMTAKKVDGEFRVTFTVAEARNLGWKGSYNELLLMTEEAAYYTDCEHDLVATARDMHRTQLDTLRAARKSIARVECYIRTGILA